MVTFYAFLGKTKKKCNKFTDLVHIVTRTGAAVGNFCHAFLQSGKSSRVADLQLTIGAILVIIRPHFGSLHF